MFIHTLLTSLTKKMTFFMLSRSIATRDENCSVRLQNDDRPFVETRAIDFAAEFSPSLNCEFKV
jgi:hypothetical protein